jgi:hypothetical protein
MPTLVVDASVVVALIAGLEPRVRTSGRRDASLVAPSHLDAEALSALFRLACAGAFDDAAWPKPPPTSPPRRSGACRSSPCSRTLWRCATT